MIRSMGLGMPIVTAALALGLSGCVAGGSPSAEQVAAAPNSRVISAEERPTIEGQSSWSGNLAAAGMDLTSVARDERGWLILWQLIGEEPPADLPDDTMAVGVFLGARPTDGYSVGINEVVSSDNGMVVRYSENEPAVGADVADAVIAPYTVMLLPESADVVHFERLR
ncbi:protease complex subunit PrcB family protein [Fodinicurvata sp. EGI_FJ10296]|uniref:protease complex subunit PrcB family protein n=1 Tax=Fodinicurvata sp. EGI_FJ10296 TaxID=3231908 RepID=UPI00345638C2